MKDNTKLTIVIASLAIIIALILGGTLAYWQWATSASENTLVNVTLTDDARMIIDFPSEDITNMYPTSDCEVNGTSSWVTEITVNNGTGVVLSPNFKLKVRILDKNGNAITNTKNTGNSQPNRYYIKYAVTGETSSCQNALITGRFDQNTQTVSGNSTWYDSKLITLYDDSTDFPIVSGKNGSGVSFYAKENAQTKQKYKVYVWLDQNYTSVNVGGSVSDTMQDAKVTVSWSENSTLTQVKRAPKTGTAYAVYSADDESLRFYRSSTAITKGSTYNGRTVSEVYTGFEIDTYTLANLPWKNCGAEMVIFEDLIQPVSTASWFDNMNVFFFDVSKLDMSKVTDMSYMFDSTTYVNTILGIENWDVSNVTNMEYVFNYSAVRADSSLDLLIADWDTSNVTNMDYMFEDSNVNADLSGWNVCNVSSRKGFANLAEGVVVQPSWGMSC